MKYNTKFKYTPQLLRETNPDDLGLLLVSAKKHQFKLRMLAAGCSADVRNHLWNKMQKDIARMLTIRRQDGYEIN